MTNRLKSYLKKIITRFSQILYLTIAKFTKNALWESAAACSFGFIFSFIPITLIIFAVLAGVLRVYPNIYNFIISFMQEFDSIVNIQPVLDRLMQTKSITGFNIFLAMWVVWMARKLFNSIIGSLNKIFRSVHKRKAWFNQLLTFISEFVITLVIIAIVIAAFIFSKILALPFFHTIFSKFPILYAQLYAQSSQNFGTGLIYFILFITGAIAYRVISGTKPLFRRCFFYSALNAVSFFVVSFFLNKFVNVTNYNTIYGTISSLVLLMMKVYIFFILFLFFAQMLYVSQFFETLIQAEISTFENSNTTGFFGFVKNLILKAQGPAFVLPKTLTKSMASEVISLTPEISWMPATLKPFCCDIILIKDKDEKGSFTWIYDVGVGTQASKVINSVKGRKKIVISHFHPDHIVNLPFVKYDELYVSKYTKKYTRKGTILSEATDFGFVKILPMPSSHSKGSLALVCGDYAFLGDGTFCKYKGVHHVYNPQQLKEMIDFMEALDCKYFCLDHEQNFVQEKRPVIALYKDIYSRHKNPDGTENALINVDDYFPL